jgi:septal ring factor EnvC (AmiA/AmiB activator)
MSSKLTSYSNSNTAEIDELKDKLKQSQDLLHERNKEIREKDRLIQELKAKLLH